MKILGFPIPDMIMNLCKPAQVYLILSLISLTLYVVSMLNVHDQVLEVEPEGEGIHHYTLSGLVIKMIFTILWIYLLNYICQFKYGKKIAWFIVLLPFFFMGLMLIGLMCAVSFIALQSTKNKELQKKIDSKYLDSKPKMMEPLAKRQAQQPQQREQLSELLR
jgi:glucan phosphoethanolaminetransferase (alkaline phosphatase superfamily)